LPVPGRTRSHRGWLGLGDGDDVGRGPEETVIVTVEPWAMDVPPWADCRTTVPAG